jgi:hypothetical protein
MKEERNSYISGLREADTGDLSNFIQYLQRLGNK